MSSFVDRSVSGHNYRVAYISYLIAKLMKPDDKAFIRKTTFAGLFHDIGVLAMKNAEKVIKTLLEKSTDEEDEQYLIRRHCDIGYKMLNASIFQEEAEIIKHHHDIYNSETRNKVPEEAFIVRLADRIDVFVKNNIQYDLKREYSFIERKLESFLSNTEGFYPQAVKVFSEYISPREAFWFTIADEDVLKDLLFRDNKNILTQCKIQTI
jgi:response regulator RpfG family c-di-GMP phosphodiesterase